MLKPTYFLLVVVIALCSISNISAQSGTEFVWNPSVQLNFKTESAWSFNIGSAYRNTIANMIGEKADFESQHGQFSQGTNYAFNSSHKVNLTFTYRFNKVFREDKGNEFRITEKYSFTKKYSTIKTGHQLKVDQRILADETIHRFRYRFQVVVPLNNLESDAKKLSGVFSTEALSSFSAMAKPEIDQRFTAGLEYGFAKKAKFNFDIEYRFEDYLHDSNDRFFVYTSLSYDL